MNKIIILVLLLIKFSAFSEECTVSIENFDTKNSKIEQILISKGYIIDDDSPRFRIESSNYLGVDGKDIKVINVFEKGVQERVAYLEKKIRRRNNSLKGLKRAEKRYIRSLDKLCD